MAPNSHFTMFFFLFCSTLSMNTFAQLSSSPRSESSAGKSIAEAASVTAAVCLFLVVGLIIFFLLKRCLASRKNGTSSSSFRQDAADEEAVQDFRQFQGAVKGLIVDENGLDVVYLNNVENAELKSVFYNDLFNSSGVGKFMGSSRDRIEKSQGNQQSTAACHVSSQMTDRVSVDSAVSSSSSSSSPSSSSSAAAPSGPPPTPSLSRPLPPFPLQPPPLPTTPLNQKPTLPPPPPPPPLPPPLHPEKKVFSPTPLAPIAVKKYSSSIPSESTITSDSAHSLQKLSPLNRSRPEEGGIIATSVEESLNNGINGAGRKKLRPLHWDKLAAGADHSLVWNEILDGSFRFDDALIEELFGYTPDDLKSHETERNQAKPTNYRPTSPPPRIFILEPRRSQNIAIIVRSLAAASCEEEILDALSSGQGLHPDILEKLSKISPTKEEVTKILNFDGDPTKLADAESFLYHILRTMPSAFTRCKAMLFRSECESETLGMRRTLQTLELACKELGTRGLFLKLLEAILKAGNKLNAGTERGNAQGFNLNSLLKLSDVKSNDKTTTLLHFVVEQVAQSEGKRLLLSSTGGGGGYDEGIIQEEGNKRLSDRKCSSENILPQRLKEFEDKCITQGIPALRSLHKEFSNVKKAAAIDYKHFINICSNLTDQVTNVRRLIAKSKETDKEGGFCEEIERSLEQCEAELKVVRGEQTRVLQLVDGMIRYYQADTANHKKMSPFQLFVIIRDFLNMVDQVCSDIIQKLQRKSAVSRLASSPPLSPATKLATRFKISSSHLNSIKYSCASSSSESEDDF